MCEQDRSVISSLLPAAIALAVGVIAGSYVWTWQNNDLPEDGSVPYISDLGNANPQWYLFASGLTVVATYFAVLSVYRFKQIHYAVTRLNTMSESHRQCCKYVSIAGTNIAALIFIELSAVAMVLLAWFNDKAFHTPHDVFACICFAGLALYTIMHTIMASELGRAYAFVASRDLKAGRHDSEFLGARRHYVGAEYFQPTTKNMLAWYIVFATLEVSFAIIGSLHYLPVSWGTPSVAEWVCATAILFYFFPFYYEMQNCYEAGPNSYVRAEDAN
jgi:hypothetical protein